MCINLSVSTQAATAASGRTPQVESGTSGLFIKGAAPARDLLVVDIAGYPTDLALTIVSLQGIVNQQQPRIYLLSGEFDRLWAEWLKTRGDVERLTYIDNVQAFELIAQFRSELKGQVVVDPDVPATINIATMLAGLDGLLITSPRYADNYTTRYQLPIVADLRGRFSSNAEAYLWAWENLGPRLNHHALALQHPDVVQLRDAVIQQKLFIWWQSGHVDGGSNRLNEMQITYKVLRETPVNIPVLGYPWHGDGVGMGEHAGVKLLSQYGKFLLPADLAWNLSVHSAAKPAPIGALADPKPSPPNTPKLNQNKHYASIIMSDGDNLQALLNYFPRYWVQAQGRTTPVGWSISPATYDLLPDFVEYLAQHRLPGDYFVAAVSGVGYVYLEHYGTETADRESTLQGFLTLTNQYMQKLGLTVIWPMSASGAVDDTALRLYAENITELTAIFPDYGQKVSNYTQANQLISVDNRNVPVFHALGNGGSAIASNIGQIAGSTPPPTFTHVFALNWNIKPGDLLGIQQAQGDDYSIVSPNELALLYLQNAGKRNHT